MGEGEGEGEPRGVAPEEIVKTIWELVGLFKVRFAEVLKPFDLPPGQAMALRAIKGGVPMKELAVTLRCDPSFVTALADGLEERGLARREADSADRRVKKLAPTRKGRALIARVWRDFSADVPGVRHLNDAERRALHDLLCRMVEAERARPASVPPRIPQRPPTAKA